MKQIDLRFGGKLYMELYGEQEEEDRIKIYDSDKEYLDYFTVESLQEMADMNERSVQDILDEYAEEMSEKENVIDLLDWLCIEWEAVWPNRFRAMETLEMDIHEFDNNEWINHIGSYYIKIAEN